MGGNVVFTPALQAPIALSNPTGALTLVGGGGASAGQTSIVPPQGSATFSGAAPGMGLGQGVPSGALNVSGNAAGSTPRFVTKIAAAAANVLSAAAAPSVAVSSTGGNNSIVWKNCHIIRTGCDGNRTTPVAGSLTQCFQWMDNCIALDVNNVIGGFMFPFFWADLEGPTAGDYTGNWDSSGNAGDQIVAALIQHAKSYNPPRSIGIAVNGNGNGQAVHIGNTFVFPSYFAPAYLNNTAYGGGGGTVGVEYSSPNPTTPGATVTAVPIVATWHASVAARAVALMDHYYQKFGPDTPTGGIAWWDPFQEMSYSVTTTYSNEEFLTTCQNVLIPGPNSGMRAAAPRWMQYWRVTFLKGNTANQSYGPLYDLMQKSYITPADEDTCNKTAGTNPRESWGSQFARGITTFNGGTQNPNAKDYRPLLGYMGNCEDAELCFTANGGTRIGQGSGYLHDTVHPTSTTTDHGIMQGVNLMNMAGMMWYADAPTIGYNINRGPNTSINPSLPPPTNPPGGPNAGSTAKLPGLISCITNDPAYASLNMIPMPIPNAPKPAGFP